MTGTDQIEHSHHMISKLAQNSKSGRRCFQKAPEDTISVFSVDTDETQPPNLQKLAWGWVAKRLAVGKRPVESGLNQAPRTGFVN